jgi:hypothetical protein
MSKLRISYSLFILNRVDFTISTVQRNAERAREDEKRKI